MLTPADCATLDGFVSNAVLDRKNEGRELSIDLITADANLAGLFSSGPRVITYEDVWNSFARLNIRRPRSLRPPVPRKFVLPRDSRTRYGMNLGESLRMLRKRRLLSVREVALAMIDWRKGRDLGSHSRLKPNPKVNSVMLTIINAELHNRVSEFTIEFFLGFYHVTREELLGRGDMRL